MKLPRYHSTSTNAWLFICCVNPKPELKTQKLKTWINAMRLSFPLSPLFHKKCKLLTEDLPLAYWVAHPSQVHPHQLQQWQNSLHLLWRQQPQLTSVSVSSPPAFSWAQLQVQHAPSNQWFLGHEVCPHQCSMRRDQIPANSIILRCTIINHYYKHKHKPHINQAIVQLNQHSYKLG